MEATKTNAERAAATTDKGVVASPADIGSTTIILQSGYFVK